MVQPKRITPRKYRRRKKIIFNIKTALTSTQPVTLFSFKNVDETE
jgi:hypothetical protein